MSNPIFTDYLGNPISVGDIIIYPSASGSSSAENNLAKVAEIIALVQHPRGWVREDQQHKMDPTTYSPPYILGTYKNDPTKSYVIRVHRREPGGWSDRLQFIRNVDRVTVVTSLTGIR